MNNKDKRDHFRKFKLELHPDKTRLIEFGRYAAENRKRRGEGKPETFDFLGFTHVCNRTKRGKFIVQRQTIRKRMQAKLREIKEELLFLCMLAYYVQWHMRKALSTVLFQDDDLEEARWTRDAVTKAEPSASARAKKGTKSTPNGWPVHSFGSLLADLGTRCRNICRTGEARRRYVSIN